MRRAAAVVVAALAFVAPAPGAAGAPACAVLQVESGRSGAASTLVRIELPAGTVVPVGRLGFHVNAIGYARRQDLAYGIANRGDFHEGAHVVTIDRRGRVTDLGPVRDTGPVRVPSSGLAGAMAGAVAGTVLYVRERDRLYGLDVDPASRTYLGLLSVVRLHPVRPALTVDDFDVNPADGLLYGVATSTSGGVVVSLNPANGAVRHGPPARLPAGPGYGAVVIGPDRAMYATNNRSRPARSGLYRIPLDGSGSVQSLGSRPPVATSDAAGCLGVSPQPAPPPPTPPPVPSPVPPPSASPPPPPPAVAVPQPRPTRPRPAPPPRSTPRPLPATVIPPPPPPPGPPLAAPQTKAQPGLKRPAPAAQEPDDPTETKRRWGLVTLLLTVGAGAAARACARRR
jgi:hypothetical protein